MVAMAVVLAAVAVVAPSSPMLLAGSLELKSLVGDLIAWPVSFFLSNARILPFEIGHCHFYVRSNATYTKQQKKKINRASIGSQTSGKRSAVNAEN